MLSDIMPLLLYKNFKGNFLFYKQKILVSKLGIWISSSLTDKSPSLCVIITKLSFTT